LLHLRFIYCNVFSKSIRQSNALLLKTSQIVIKVNHLPTAVQYKSTVLPTSTCQSWIQSMPTLCISKMFTSLSKLSTVKKPV